VRLSGKDSEAIIRKSCVFLPKVTESHRVYYGHLSFDGKDIDEVLVTYFQAGKSFTGEKTFEISCHGSPFVAQEIVDVLVKSGARVAEPGEFTFRAFMSGRIDLVQAEAVLDLIESESRRASSLALRQLKGQLSEIVKSVENDLVGVLAHVEANIDFAAEDIEIESNDSMAVKLKSIIKRVESLLETYQRGKAIHEGVGVALVGVPNVGKSSLLNALVDEEKAIVTEVEGTTRDVVEGTFEWKGIRFNVFDTAGMRETSDKVESLGIERTLKQIEKSEIKVIVLDGSEPKLPDLEKFELDKESTLFVLNKSDLLQGTRDIEFLSPSIRGFDHMKVSAKTNQGIEALKTVLADRFGLKGELNQTAMLTNSRHLQALTISLESLRNSLGLLETQESPDFIAFELMEGLKAVQSLLGKRFDDEVMDRVFREFCLGK
jgi:tRNA modification GTPase